jgi:hypothetical protein
MLFTEIYNRFFINIFFVKIELRPTRLKGIGEGDAVTVLLLLE